MLSYRTVILLALSATIPAAAHAQVGARAPEVRAAASACRADAQRLCASIERGGGRVLACLEKQRAAVSPACGAALDKAAAARPAAPAPASSP